MDMTADGSHRGNGRDMISEREAAEAEAIFKTMAMCTLYKCISLGR
jgi:hypothetical protein